MESSPNRFVDSEDMSVDDCDLKKLMEDCEKWSLKNDLQLLSHLKQMSNSLLDKTENANQSINNLVFNTKIHCVKVDNVINEFQMLANSQFVENRVYDEEVEDIITSAPNQQNDETVGNKSKDEEILNKIKAALNIGLDFMSQRFECVSNKVSQNDSDDENDQILEGLITNSSKDEYSQRLLPYIIGSDDFIKDNYVGLNFVEESPVIDLSKTRLDNDLSVKSVDSYESVTSEVRTPVPIVNNVLDIDDSEDESNDLFGTVPKIPEINQKSVSSDESDSDSDPFVSEDKELTKPETVKSNEWKPSVPSFQDELSAAISAKNPNKTFAAEEEIEEQKDKPKPKQLIVNESQTKTLTLTPSFESESSDESDSIFNVSKTKPKPENRNKVNNFSNLFGEEPTDDLIFDKPVQTKRDTEPSNKVDKILPQNSQKDKISPVKTKGLFDDDDDDEDDLFGAISKNVTNKTTKHIPSDTKAEVDTKTKGSIENNLDKKPTVSKTKGLFSDDEEEDDLFSGLSSKSMPNNSQNSDAFKPIVNQSVDPIVNKPKPNNSFIGELSSALKNKKLFRSDDEESDSNSDSDSNVKKHIENEIISEIKTESQINSMISKEKEIDSLFGDNKNSDNSFIKAEPSVVPSDSNPAENEFYPEKPTLTLSNDGLKHRALLGSKRNRRPPTKKVLKMSPITDLYQTSEQSPEVQPIVEPNPPPVAAVRTVKTSNSESLSESSKQTDDYIKSDIFLDNSVRSVASLVKSPSTEEDDIFPTQTNVSKNQNMSKIFEKSENPSISLFNDPEDNEESLFSSKSSQIDTSKKLVDKKGIFDTSDSDDDNFFSNKSSNVISNIIKPSNSELFNDVSSTDSSLSNKSDLKVDSKPAISLFSDSDDDDLFSAVNRNKSVDKQPDKQKITAEEIQSKPISQTNETKNQKLKKNNSLFSDDDDEDNTDLFDKKDIKTITKSKVKPIFDLEDDDDDDEDIFAPKTSKTTKKPTTKSSIIPKTQKESQSSDLFDDPLFASRS